MPNLRTMSDVRQSVDILDKMIVDLLLERFRLMDNAATLKLDRNQVLDIQRKMAVIANAKAYAQQVGMSDIGINTVEAIWHTLVNGCINHEFVVFDFLSGDNTPRG